MRRLRGLFIVHLAFAVLLSVVDQAHATDVEVSGATILVSVASLSEDAETVRRVALASMELYLEQQGIVAVRAERAPVAGELARDLSREGRSAGAQFILQGFITSSPGEVDVEIELFLVDGAQPLSTAAATEPVGLTLDRAIAGLTGNVLEQARSYLVAAAAVQAESHDSARGAVESRDPSAIGRSPSSEMVVVPNRLFALEASYSPFFPIDRSGRYIGASYKAVSMSLLSLPFRSDVVGLGITGRGILADATGAAASAALQIVPFGITVRVSGVPGPFAPYLRAAGGAALLRAENDALGGFMTIVPYASGELGMRIEMMRFLGAQFFVAFDAVFESSLWILGFSPGIGLAIGM